MMQKACVPKDKIMRSRQSRSVPGRKLKTVHTSFKINMRVVSCCCCCCCCVVVVVVVVVDTFSSPQVHCKVDPKVL